MEVFNENQRETVLEFFKDYFDMPFVVKIDGEDRVVERKTVAKNEAKVFQMLEQNQDLQQKLEQLQQSQELSQETSMKAIDQMEQLMRNYQSLQETKNQRLQLDAILTLDQFSNDIVNINQKEGCLKKLKSLLVENKSLSETFKVLSQSCNEEDLMAIKDKLKQEVSKNTVIKEAVQQMASRLVAESQQKIKDDEGLKRLESLGEIIKNCRLQEGIIDIGEVMFEKQVEALRYHFLRQESELNSREHPEWLLKFIKEQCQKIYDKLYSTSPATSTEIIRAYLQQSVSIIKARLLLDTSISQGESQNSHFLSISRMIDFIIEYDHEFLKLMPSEDDLPQQLDTPFTIFEALTQSLGEDNESEIDVYRTLVENLKQSFNEQFSDLHELKSQVYKVLALDQIPNFFKRSVVERFMIYGEQTRLQIAEKVIQPMIKHMVQTIKDKINDHEFKMLNLQTKADFNLFLDTQLSIRTFKKSLSSFLKQNQSHFKSLSTEDFEDLLGKMDKMLIEHFEAKIIPKSAQLLLNQVDLKYRLKSYLSQVHSKQLAVKINHKWALRITLVILIKLKKKFERVSKKVNDIQERQKYVELRQELTQIVQKENIDFAI